MAVGGALGLIWSLVTPRHFAWQAWHKLKSTVVLRGRRGTNPHLPSFCVAGVALMAVGGALGLIWSPVTPRHFAWQAWHKLTSTIVLRGRRGTNSHLPSFFVAGVAQTYIYHLSHTTLSHAIFHISHLPGPSFCVTGVALMAVGGALGLIWSPVTPRHFAWQAWHKLTSTVVLRGRRGTNSHLPSFFVAGVAQTYIYHLSHTTLSHAIFHISHLPGPSFCVTGVALMALGGALGLIWSPVTPRHFAWQAWHKLTMSLF